MARRFATLLVLLGLALGASCAREPEPIARPVVRTERIGISVGGMHCGGCANVIAETLRVTPGVVSADVSFEHREADVVFEPDRATPTQLIAAIRELGYEARLVS